jgi:ribosomal protein S18 acetylase RimI-like enzyme
MLDREDPAGSAWQAHAYYEPARATDGTWYLTLIAVRREVQGQGRGAALLHDVEHLLQAQGQRVLLVETSGLPAFARTRTFYTKCGYVEEARVRDYYAAGDDMVLFRKVLHADDVTSNGHARQR